MSDYVLISAFLGFAIGMVLMLGVGMPLLERRDSKLNYYFDFDNVKIHSDDAIAMVLSLVPGIAMAYTMINIMGIVKAIGEVALGWVIFAEFFALIFLGLIDPPYTDLTLIVDLVIIFTAVGYLLLRFNIVAAIVLFVVGGLTGIVGIPHYLDIVLCRRISAWRFDCKDYYCDEFEYRWCKARWESGYRTPCSCRFKLKCCKHLDGKNNN